mmetsp:Transcript_13029/g.21414  ORF Transcript_13029/g.21414 Transcript_13029/m.21414 type:complete len:97 (+) Transcript_13029:246-536(+)
MIVSGRDVFFSEESDKASNVSNKDTAAAAGGTRRRCRRQPPPDGYLYDVSKTKEYNIWRQRKKARHHREMLWIEATTIKLNVTHHRSRNKTCCLMG